jgi:hypothetical protein
MIPPRYSRWSLTALLAAAMMGAAVMLRLSSVENDLAAFALWTLFFASLLGGLRRNSASPSGDPHHG